MPSRPGPHRQRLARELRALRAGTGLSGNQFAKRIGWIQSRVSKIERGETTPTPDDIRQWVEHTSGSPDDETRLLDMLHLAKVEHETFRGAGQAGRATTMQNELATLEEMATRIGKFEPNIIPAQVQTRQYAEEMSRHIIGGAASFGFTEEEINAIVDKRMARQRILDDPGRTVQVIILETALWYPLASPATMREQLHRLGSLSGMRALEFGVIPMGTPLPATATHGFRFFDDVYLGVETMTGYTEYRDPGEIKMYLEAFDAMRGLALYGEDLEPILRRAYDGLGDYPWPPNSQ